MRFIFSIIILMPSLLFMGGLFFHLNAQELEEHWKRPIPFQGEPPVNLSPLETSLNPKACGICHVEQYSQWKTALHSRSMGPGVLGQLLDMKDDVNRVVSCMICHAPLDEQIDELLDGYVPEGLVFPDKDGLLKTGVSCGVCHVRNYIRFGPEPRVKKRMENPPHDGFKVLNIFTDSRFCAPCHQFPENGYRLNGKLFENTYNEWLDSPYPKRGIGCQSCHMPERKHLWRGIHEPDFVRKAIEVDTDLTVNDNRIISTIVLKNRRAGHYFPTYAVPLVVITGYQVDEKNNLIDGTVVEGMVGRRLPLDLSYEIFDTRIPPEGKFSMKYDRELSKNAKALRFEIVVYPDEFYSRFYKNLLDGRYIRQGREFIEKALKNSLSSNYTLFEKTIPFN